jgi:hypothetical protein
MLFLAFCLSEEVCKLSDCRRFFLSSVDVELLQTGLSPVVSSWLFDSQTPLRGKVQVPMNRTLSKAEVQSQKVPFSGADLQSGWVADSWLSATKPDRYIWTHEVHPTMFD